jgi:hypothetical protein
MTKLLPSVALASLTIISCRSADTGLTAFVPADTIALAGMRMDQVKATELYKKLRAQKRFSELDDLKNKTGFDPTRDVSELLLATNGKEAVTIARGHFAPADPTAQKSAYKGYTLNLHGSGAYALIDGATAVAGTLPAVKAAIDQFKTGTRTPSVTALLTRARALPPTAQIWAVSDSPDAFASLMQSGSAGNFGKVFGQLDSLTFTADFSKGLSAVATGDCHTDQDAKTLGDAIRGLVSLGKMSVPQGQSDLLRLYDSVQVEQQQKSVKLIANVAPDLIDKLMQLTDTARGARSTRTPQRP